MNTKTTPSLSRDRVEKLVLVHAVGDSPTTAAQVTARLGLHPHLAEAVGEALEELLRLDLVEVDEDEQFSRSARGARELAEVLGAVGAG